jgi:hypothetical protein
MTLSILGGLKRELGDLDGVTAWLIVHGLGNAVPDFTLTTNVINGFSDMILELYGREAGTHARDAGHGDATAGGTDHYRGGGGHQQLESLDQSRRLGTSENPYLKLSEKCPVW